MYVQATCQHAYFTKRANIRSLLKAVQTRYPEVQSELKEIHKITWHYSVQTPVHS
jgi:hypothetical protein